MKDFWTLGREQVMALEAGDFAVRRHLDTRWRDNDIFGHVNNAVYYEYFDTAINTWLLEALAEDPDAVAVQRFVVESGCRYLGPLSYPARLLVAHRVARLGSTSVTYELAIFPMTPAGPGRIAALARWVQVFIDPTSQRPVPIPGAARELLESANTD